MGNPRGFLTFDRKKGGAEKSSERLSHYREFETPLPAAELKEQAARCMDCGIPFCHKGCPLGNLIPEWNDYVYQGDFKSAVSALLATNNFPEVTGRVCPAPCEAACVLNIENRAVTIKEIERSISNEQDAFGLYAPQKTKRSLGTRVAVVGSGPAGLAAAQELARLGHGVTVFERDDRVGGLLRYGIPDFKLEKDVLDKRIAQLTQEGVRFETNVHVGGTLTGEALLRDYDGVVLAMGARRPRDLTVPGRELSGVHFAMDFLTQQNRRVAGDSEASAPILATNKHVIILGGGDTGSDCLGTSLRQGAKSVTQLELLPKPPSARGAANPWPEWPLIMRTSSSQEEGGARDFAVMTKELVGQGGHVTALRCVRVEPSKGGFLEIAGSSFELPCDLALLAMGFVGPEADDIVTQLGLTRDARGNIAAKQTRTNVSRVFAAGDVARGASLVVWAIREGRDAAAALHAELATNAARVKTA